MTIARAIQVGIETGCAHLPKQATFPRAPLRSRTVGFPESGSDLGCIHFAFLYIPRFKCWHSYPPIGYLVCSKVSLRLSDALSVSVYCASLRPPSAQRSFASTRCYLLESTISLYLRRHYPSLIATTTSCANPKSSHFLRWYPIK